MRKTILLIAMFLMAGTLSAQGIVTIVPNSGDNTEITLDATGEIIIGADNVLITTSTQSSTIHSFAISDIRKMLFVGILNIVDISGSTPLTFAPNPAGGMVTVSGIGDGEQTIIFYNTAGIMMMSTTCHDGATIDVSTLQQGMYIVRAGNNIGRLIIK